MVRHWIITIGDKIIHSLYYILAYMIWLFDRSLFCYLSIHWKNLSSFLLTFICSSMHLIRSFLRSSPDHSFDRLFIRSSSSLDRLFIWKLIYSINHSNINWFRRSFIRSFIHLNINLFDHLLNHLNIKLFDHLFEH